MWCSSRGSSQSGPRRRLSRARLSSLSRCLQSLGDKSGQSQKRCWVAAGGLAPRHRGQCCPGVRGLWPRPTADPWRWKTVDSQVGSQCSSSGSRLWESHACCPPACWPEPLHTQVIRTVQFRVECLRIFPDNRASVRRGSYKSGSVLCCLTSPEGVHGVTAGQMQSFRFSTLLQLVLNFT